MHMRMKAPAMGWIVSLALLLQGAAMANEPAAADEGPELFTRIKQDHVSYHINEDGTCETERTRAVTVLKERAVTYSKQTSISHSTSAEKSEILDAYTLKPDGRRLDAPPSNFQIETNGGKDQATAAFSDRTSVTVVFPEVAVGDTVVIHYRITTTDPIFPKQFSTMDTFSRTMAYDDVRVSFDAPASMWTQFQIKDLKEVENTEKDGRRHLVWTWENKRPIKSKRDNYSVWDADKEPGYAFSTFRTYADIAESYGLRARPKAAVTPRIQKLADEITQGKSTPRDMARALYEWVAVNISYAGNCVGIGTVVPRDLDFVVGNRMGDCKDHATLLQALLEAKGIHSTQALINSGSSYRLQKVPVVAMVNHVITYIPSMDLYLDSTSESTPFGMLPFGDADKPVLLVDGYKEGTRTPKIPPTLNGQAMKINMRIDENGNVKGNAQVDLKGHLAVGSRDYFRHLGKDDEAELVKRYFQYAGLDGSGKIAQDDPKAMIGTYRYKVDFEVAGKYDLPGPGAFVIEPLVFNQRPVAAYVASLMQPAEEVDSIACVGGEAEDDYVIELPASVKVTAMPPDLNIASGPYAYRASYKRQGRKLTVSRRFEDRTIGQVCEVSADAGRKAFVDKVVKNMRAQVLYQPAH
jgi:transglutaminase-like putative cysteine protease